MRAGREPRRPSALPLASLVVALTCAAAFSAALGVGACRTEGAGVSRAALAPELPIERGTTVSSETPPASESSPECRSMADIERRDGQPCVVVGTYEQLDVRMRQRGEPVYRGHVVIRLGDGTMVTLEPIWAATAIRPSDEIERFEGKTVAVRGTVRASAPEPPEPIASIANPCVSPVEAVEAR